MFEGQPLDIWVPFYVFCRNSERETNFVYLCLLPLAVKLFGKGSILREVFASTGAILFLRVDSH